jgi:hypothetical protein
LGGGEILEESMDALRDLVPKLALRKEILSKQPLIMSVLAPQSTQANDHEKTRWGSPRLLSIVKLDNPECYQYY